MHVQKQILTIEEKPDWLHLGIVLGGFWIMLPFIASKSWEVGVIFALLITGLTIFLLYSAKTIRCVMNKDTRQMTYEAIGILGGKYNQKRAMYRLADIRRVQIKRHIQRGRDQFDCRLLMQNNETLPISQLQASLQVCEWYAKKVHTFLELKPPVQFVD